MNNNKFWAALGKALAVVTAILIVILVVTPGARAATEKVLYSFTGGADGNGPAYSLIFDQAGELYGATRYGGDYGNGTVFKLSPNPDGSWTESVLYTFTGGSDGLGPDCCRLTFDIVGNLYGTTLWGGNYGVGVFFQLAPNMDGSWTETVLHQFTGGKDGGQPRTTSFFDAQGVLYGTAAEGGAYGCGTVFKMTPGSDDKWTYRVIHQFKGQPACSPWVGLIPDKAGRLYGTTRNTVGGCSNPPNECGTVFQLTPTSDGKWTFKVIHKFTGGKGGSDPSISGLVFDDSGNLYGTTEHGGINESGVFFKMMPGANNQWSYGVLHRFKESVDGNCPTGRPVRDTAGNIYGTLCLGGIYGYGTVYKMTPSPDETWTFNVVYAFAGSDGAYPTRAVTLDATGNLFGVTFAGGAYGAGTVYEITP